MSLYTKASIILAPGAYKEGVIFNQKPLSEASDLTFDRGTSATEVTRVDNNSVIKESILLGSEVLVNGDFSSDSSWTTNEGVTITGGNVNFPGDNGWVKQNITNPSSYRLTFNVSSVTKSGVLRIRSAVFNQEALITINSTGEYIIDNPVTNDGLALQSNDFIGSISSVSVKPIIGDIPRINYLGDDGGYLLIEPESTNTATYSNDFTRGIILGGSDAITAENSLILSSSQGISPDGSNNSWKIQVGSTLNVMHHLKFGNAIIETGVVNTVSIFAKKGANIDHFAIFYDTAEGFFRAWFDLENGVKGTLQNGLSSKMEDYGNGWYRCSISFQTTTSTSGNLRFVLAKTDGGSNFIGGTNEYHYIYGVQGEVNAFPTSYIPTSGGTATRDAETAINGGDSTMFNDDEGVLYIEAARFEGASYSGAIGVCDANANNSVYIIIGNASVRGVVRASSNVYISSHNASNLDSFNKIAFQYKSGASKIFFNGSQLGSTSTDTWSTNAPKIKLNFDRGDGTDPFQGKIKCIAVFKETLTDSELQQLTS